MMCSIKKFNIMIIFTKDTMSSTYNEVIYNVIIRQEYIHMTKW